MKIIYTDGACKNNGYENAKAGIGVFFGDSDPRNVSMKVDKSYKQTNNVAELLAIIKAIEIIKNDKTVKYKILTDSEYAIKCANNFSKWLKTKTQSKIKNFELVSQLHTLIESTNIKLEYVKAHTGLPDEDSYGNEQADKLANNAIGVETLKKTMLSIPFEVKDKAKELGAKWDNEVKRWYYEGNDISIITQLQKLEVKENYINISFANKDKAKSLGAKWNGVIKKWYYLDNIGEENITKLLALSK